MRFAVLAALLGPGILALPACSSADTAFPAATRTAPSAIPPYPNAREERAEGTRIGGDEVRIVAFRTPDPPARVMIFYKGELTKSGWTVQSQCEQEFLVLVNSVACPVYGLYVTATPAEQATSVELRLGTSRCGAH